MRLIHDEHPEIFEMENALWIRSMSGDVERSLFHDEDFGAPQLVELCVDIVAEKGSSVALLGIALEAYDEDVEDESIETVPVTVYYYTMLDEGRTDLDVLFIAPIDPEEELIELPEWLHE